MAGDTEIAILGRYHIQQFHVSDAEELGLKTKRGTAGQYHDLIAIVVVPADDAQGPFVV
jgi:hypothetical protein